MSEAMWKVHLVLVFSSLITLICLGLIFHDKYQDGIVGRFALWLIIFASIWATIDAADGYVDFPVREALLMQIGVFLFLLRHFMRFLTRISKTNDPYSKRVIGNRRKDATN